MKLGIILSQTEPETVCNALRLASYSLLNPDPEQAGGVICFRGTHEHAGDQEHGAD